MTSGWEGRNNPRPAKIREGTCKSCGRDVVYSIERRHWVHKEANTYAYDWHVKEGR